MQCGKAIYVIDDHALFRESLVRLLASEADLSVVGQSECMRIALDYLRAHTVDIVLLDYNLGTPGVDWLHGLRDFCKVVKVLVVTAGIGDALTLDILSAGAVGVFNKCSSPSLLIEAIHTTLRGEVCLDQGTLRAMIAAAGRAQSKTNGLSPLSRREQLVLSDILAGLSNKEIAWKREVSLTTVKCVVQDLFVKAGVRTRSQLVRVALEKHSSDWLSDPTG